jgi:L1 cell adhesion molecule like protein
VLIFDLGGGTFDVSLLKIDAGVFTVLATAGDTHLGGEDFDDRLVTFVRGQFEKKNKCDISESARALRRLRGACESAKRTLSSMTKAVIEVESLFEGQDLSVTVSRAKFEELCADLFQNTLKPVAKVLKDAGIEKSLVDDIVLVGGSTRVPKIQSLLEEFFEGKKLNKTINPDEAVAYGAAVQASILSGNRNDSTEDMLLLDVVPLSLGIEMQGGIMSTVVPRNTPIPCMKTSMFTTTENNQTEVEFPVYEGERMLTKDNNLLGAFTLSGIPPLPKGEAELEVQFFLDANGILTVTATDKQTGKKNNITIANDNGRLSSDDIERMVQDAKRYKLEDERRKESLSAREEFESYTNQVQETLATGVVADKLGDHHMEEIDEMLGDAVEWLDSNTTATKQEILDEKKALERRISTIFAKLVASS